MSHFFSFRTKSFRKKNEKGQIYQNEAVFFFFSLLVIDAREVEQVHTVKT